MEKKAINEERRTPLSGACQDVCSTKDWLHRPFFCLLSCTNMFTQLVCLVRFVILELWIAWNNVVAIDKLYAQYGTIGYSPIVIKLFRPYMYPYPELIADQDTWSQYTGYFWGLSRRKDILKKIQTNGLIMSIRDNRYFC